MRARHSNLAPFFFPLLHVRFWHPRTLKSPGPSWIWILVVSPIRLGSRLSIPKTETIHSDFSSTGDGHKLKGAFTNDYTRDNMSSSRVSKRGEEKRNTCNTVVVLLVVHYLSFNDATIERASERTISPNTPLRPNAISCLLLHQRHIINVSDNTNKHVLLISTYQLHRYIYL